MARKLYFKNDFCQLSRNYRTVLDILSYLEPTIGPAMIGPGEKVQSKGSQMTGKGYFDIGFCIYSKYFLKLYVPLTTYKSCILQLLKNYLILKHPKNYKNTLKKIIQSCLRPKVCPQHVAFHK